MDPRSRKLLEEESGSFSDHISYRSFIEDEFKKYGYSVIIWIDILAHENSQEISDWISDTGVNFTSRGIPMTRWRAFGFAPLPGDIDIALQFKLKFGGRGA